MTPCSSSRSPGPAARISAQRRGLRRPSASAARAPRADVDVRGRAAHDRAARSRTSPRASRRRSAAGVGAGAARQRGRAARAGASVSRSASASPRVRARAHSAVFARVPAAAASSASARAGVEQYSSAIHSASSTSSGGQRRLGQDPPRVGQLVLGVARPARSRRRSAAAERHHQQRADADAVGPPVVERPAQRAGRGERLDLDDGRWHPPSG